MRITRINRLRGCGVFRDFAWPSDLPPFGRYNLIYGWNGTGKSTLGEILRALQEKRRPPLGEVEIEIDNRTVSGASFDLQSAPIRVFNRAFVEASVFKTNGDAARIYVLGEASVEKQKRRDEVYRMKVAGDGDLSRLRESKQNAETAQDTLCKTNAQQVKERLRPAGQAGSHAYSDYNKAGFRTRCQRMVIAGDADRLRLSDDGLADVTAQAVARPLEALSPLSLPPVDLNARRKAVAALASKSVVSSVIAALRDAPDTAKWVLAGLSLHDVTGSKECLYCGLPVPPARAKALEEHFNDEYQSLMDGIVALAAALLSDQEALAVVPPDEARVYERLRPAYRQATAELARAVAEATEYVSALTKLIDGKKASPFKAMTDMPVDAPTLAAALAAVNSVIAQHNADTAAFNQRVDEARRAVEAHVVAVALPRFVELQNDIGAKRDAIVRTEELVRQYQDEIDRLDRDILSYQKPADDINRVLPRYLGHDELRLVPKETGYEIRRGELPAVGLSEGEKTALALLYFLESLKATEVGDLKDAIVVLDDPVSSLDQNALYGVFGAISAATRHAGQVVILTHNFSLFRAVKQWFRKADKDRSQFYMLATVRGEGGRTSALKALDPMLKKYDSDYHYLYARLVTWAVTPVASGIEEYYHAPSVARRVLETFLAFRVPQKAHEGGLLSQMQSVASPGQEAVVPRLYRFLQCHAHHDTVGEYDEDQTVLAETPAVLRDLLEFMRVVDQKHCEGMNAAVNGLSTR